MSGNLTMLGVAKSMLKREKATLSDLVDFIYKEGFNHIHFGGLFSCASILDDLKDFLTLLHDYPDKNANMPISTSVDTNFDASQHWGFAEVLEKSEIDALPAGQSYAAGESNLWTIFNLIDFGLFNDVECRMMAGGFSDLESSLKVLSTKFRKAIIASRSEEGALGMVKGSNSLFSCHSILVDVVDTTGAGDCFNAGFIHHYLANRQRVSNDEDLIASSAQFGCFAGSVGVTKFGASDIPITFTEVKSINSSSTASASKRTKDE